MANGSSFKIVAASLCLGFCVLAHAQASLPREQRHLSDQRLPGEPPPPFATKWGTSGSGDGQFSYPIDVAIDTSGNIYVSDYFNDRIQKFDSSGTFLSKWGTSGSGDGEFNQPRGVAVDASGNVYVSDHGNHRIQKFDSSGTFLTKWGTNGSGDGHFDYPFGVAIDASGNIYVADAGNHRIQKFDSSGTFLTKWGTSGSGDDQFNSPYSVAIDASGNVYVADVSNHRIQKFDSSGTFLTKWGTSGSGDGQFNNPNGVAVGASGNVYVADTFNHRIQKFDSSGTFLTKWGTNGSGDGQFSSAPRGMAVDASGNVYVADSGNDRIQKFGPAYETLVFIKEWGSLGTGDGEFAEPHGLAADASGNTYVADRGNRRIQKFDASGRFVSKWDSTGTAEGQFGFPEHTAIDGSGNVYVTDPSRGRIQKFDGDGNFLRMWGWGVQDGSPAFQICTAGCQAGTSGSGAGQFDTNSKDLAVDASGNVYVADDLNHRVQKFDSSGNFLLTWGWGVDDGTAEFQTCTSGCQAGISGGGTGQFNRPFGIDPDASGNVYVTEGSNDRVQKFDSSGNFLLMWGWGVDDGTAELQTCTSGCQAGLSGTGNGQLNVPFELNVDAAGNIFVADDGNRRIQKFDSSGNFLTRWGTQGTGEGQFEFPQGVTTDASGNVYVADSGNDRIQKFGPCGFTMTPFSLFFTAGAGGGSFSFDAVVEECGWTATPSQSWITVTSGFGGTGAGLGDGSVDFTVAANPTAFSRGGYIHISDETTGGLGVPFSIIQDAAPCTYELSSSSASFSGTAGADFVSITSLLGCTWSATSNDPWISVDAGTPGSGNGVVLYSVTANLGSLVRAGTMTIAGHTFTVNQDPQIPDAPSNLACAAVNSTKIKMTWTDNAGNEAELRVERKLGVAGSFTQIVALPSDTTGYTDRGLERQTEYVYRVMACNSAGCSDPSAEATVTTPALGFFIGEEPDAVWQQTILNWFEELKQRVPTER